MRTPTEAVEAVISIAFAGVVARAADAFGVSDMTVHWWRKGERDGKPVRFPAEFCPKAERLTNGCVTCEELRPDVEDWEYLRGTERRDA